MGSNNDDNDSISRRRFFKGAGQKILLAGLAANVLLPKSARSEGKITAVHNQIENVKVPKRF